MTDKPHTPTTQEVQWAAITTTFEDSSITEDAFSRWLDARDARIIATAKAEAYKEAQQIVAGDMTIAEQRGRRGADKVDAAYLIRELDQEIQELQEGDDETH